MYKKITKVIWIVLLFGFLFSSMFCNSVLAGWLAGWNYRKPIDVSGSGSTLNDYQVSITTTEAGTGSLISGGKLETDYRDLRFTDFSGDTQLSYWIESNVVSVTGFLVKISTILVSGTTIYMY